MGTANAWRAEAPMPQGLSAGGDEVASGEQGSGVLKEHVHQAEGEHQLIETFLRRWEHTVFIQESIL